MKDIKGTHKENKKNVLKYGVTIGQTWRHKETKKETEIKNIHPLYFWVVSEPYAIKQDLSNIKEYEVKQNDTIRHNQN